MILSLASTLVFNHFFLYILYIFEFVILFEIIEFCIVYLHSLLSFDDFYNGVNGVVVNQDSW